MDSSTKNQIKDLLKSKDDTLLTFIRSLLHSHQDFVSFSFFNTIRKKATHIKGNKKIKIALIGSYTLYPLNNFLDLCLSCEGVSAEIFSGEYDNYLQEMIDPTSKLYDFSPDILIIQPNREKFLKLIPTGMSLDQVEEIIGNEIENLTSLIGNLPTEWNKVVLNHLPFSSKDFGLLESQLPYDQNNIIKRYNLRLGDSLPASVKIFNTDSIASRYGLDNAQDEKFYHETKNIFSPDFLTVVAMELTQFINSFYTAMHKVMVLDLDHTLWGGVIGDDGLEGIELGGTSSIGEAYKKFQETIKHFKDRGVLLAICSKNEESIATEAIEKHPEMVLKKDDFILKKINWNPKSENIKEIAEELNLGLSSIVFIDDNPAEIEIVNQYLPEVATITLNTHPSKFSNMLRNSSFFEPRNFTLEDMSKSDQYKQEFSRKELQKKVTNIRDYLDSLKMHSQIIEFNDLDLPRISQLINKSNQFNLTTIRRTQDELKGLIEKPEYMGFSVRLNDKFGDYGLISVLILELDQKKNTMTIETWVMSCRVLKRELEFEIINYLVKRAKELGVETIIGKYIPTKKNIIVKDLYNELGFKEFKLSVKDYKPYKSSIEV